MIVGPTNPLLSQNMRWLNLQQFVNGLVQNIISWPYNMEIRKGYIQNWAKIVIWILKLQIVWTWKWDLYNPLMSTNRPEFCKDRGENLEGFLSIFKILKPQENQKQLLALSESRSFSCQTELLAEKEISDERKPDQCGLEEVLEEFFTFFLRIFCFPKSLSSD